MRFDVDDEGAIKPGSPLLEKPLFSDTRIEIRRAHSVRKPLPKNFHCRRQVHNLFVKWYLANEAAFKGKIELDRRTDQCMLFRFNGINDIIFVSLFGHELNVGVEVDGHYWDNLCSFDCLPRRVPMGYVCALCDEETRLVYPSREAVWRFDIFDPFLAWVNTTLAEATELSLTGTPGWFSSAKLISTHDKPENSADEPAPTAAH